VGPVRSFQVAGGRPADVTALFITATQGALTDAYTTGTFGAGLLGPARVVFDYPRRRVAIAGGA
jgi:hypothetical protein